ncbi:hypothetical protein GN956_G19358 [Arapaima gigas]
MKREKPSTMQADPGKTLFDKVCLPRDMRSVQMVSSNSGPSVKASEEPTGTIIPSYSHLQVTRPVPAATCSSLSDIVCRHRRTTPPPPSLSRRPWLCLLVHAERRVPPRARGSAANLCPVTTDVKIDHTAGETDLFLSWTSQRKILSEPFSSRPKVFFSRHRDTFVNIFPFPADGPQWGTFVQHRLTAELDVGLDAS